MKFRLYKDSQKLKMSKLDKVVSLILFIIFQAVFTIMFAMLFTLPEVDIYSVGLGTILLVFPVVTAFIIVDIEKSRYFKIVGDEVYINNYIFGILRRQKRFSINDIAKAKIRYYKSSSGIALKNKNGKTLGVVWRTPEAEEVFGKFLTD